MPKVRVLNKLTRNLEEHDLQDADRLVAEGEYDYPDAAALERGIRLEKYGSTGQQALAAGESVLRTGTFGIFDGFGSDEDIQGRRETLSEESPGISLASQLAGSAVPGLGAAKATGAGLRALGTGTRATAAGTVLAEGTAIGGAEEIEQAGIEGRPVSLGNIMLYGIGGEIIGRALPAVLARGAGKAFGKADDALSAALGEGGENVLGRTAKRGEKRAAQTAREMPPGPDREAAVGRTAGAQYEHAASELADVAPKAGKHLDDAGRLTDKKLRTLLADDAPVQTAWAARAGGQLDEASVLAKGGEAKRALKSAADELLDADGSLATFKAAARHEAALRAIPEAAEQAKALRTGLEDTSLWGRAAEYQSDLGRTRAPGLGKLSKEEILPGLQSNVPGENAAMENAVQALQDRIAVHEKWGTLSAARLDKMRETAARGARALELAQETRQVAAKAGALEGATEAGGGVLGELVETGAEKALGGGAGMAFRAVQGFRKGGLKGALAAGARELPEAAAEAVTGLPVGLGKGIAKTAWRVLDDEARAAVKQSARRIVRGGRSVADRYASGAVSEARAASVALATTPLQIFAGEYSGPEESFSAKRDLLLKASLDPDALPLALAESMGDLPMQDPELFRKLSGRMGQMLRYIGDNMPATVGNSLFHPRGVPPSESGLREFAILWNSVLYPETVIDDLEAGVAVPDQIKHLKAMNADLYQDVQQAVIEEVANGFEDIDSETKIRLGMLLEDDGIAGPAFSTLAARYVGEYQDAAASGGNAIPPASGDAEAGPQQAGSLQNIRGSVTNAAQG